MKAKRLRLFLVGVWEPILLIIAAVLIVGGLMIYHLGSLTGQLSSPELTTYLANKSLNLISKNPLNLPYKALAFIFNHFFHPSIFSLRLISVIFGLATVLLFFYVASHWYNRFIAVMGTLLFVCSAWLLHYARLATPDITATLLLAALAYGIWLKKTKRNVLPIILGSILTVSLIYSPGLIWFIFIGGVWQRKIILTRIKASKLTALFALGLAVILLTPLVIALTRQPVLVRSLIGLPNHGPPIIDFIKHILIIPVQLILRGPANPVIWLGRLPLLDLLSTVMGILGIYACIKFIRLDSVRSIFGILIIGSFLVGLNGGVANIILMPFIYLLVLAGISYLLTQWLEVFPRNPLARTIGVSLLSLAVLLACFYNLRQYFVAWPNAPATKATFRRQL